MKDMKRHMGLQDKEGNSEIHPTQMRQRRVSPSLGKLSNAFENFAVEALGKVVGQLICGGNNLKHFNVAIKNMVPKEVPLNQEILGLVGDALLGSKQQCSVVIFKDAAANGRLEVRWQSQFLADLTKKVMKRQ
jgi:hypothetical protein